MNLSLKTDFDHAHLKNARVNVRLNTLNREQLRAVWKIRNYPNPQNPSQEIPFRSEQEYLEFIICACNKMGKLGWYNFKFIHNPNYPNE